MEYSHGRVAEILGISKERLIEIHCEMGFPYYTMDISEVKEDINTYKRFFKKHKLKLYETRFS
ncbi:hypothetical protein ACTQ2N_03370 [Ruminococcus sp. LCP21S3_E8]